MSRDLRLLASRISLRAHLLGLLVFLVCVNPTMAIAGAAIEEVDASTLEPSFEELKCNRCHALEKFEIEATTTSEKMLGPDLSDVGAKRDAEWLAKFLQREIELDGSKHKSPWKGDEKQLESLSKWLASLRD